MTTKKTKAAETALDVAEKTEKINAQVLYYYIGHRPLRSSCPKKERDMEKEEEDYEKKGHS